MERLLRVLRQGKMILGLTAGFAVTANITAFASDHLDTPAAIDRPGADIGDLYAWMSPDGARLNLIMDIVGKDFSTDINYTFHVDSGSQFGNTRRAAQITCTFNLVGVVTCALGNIDRATGGGQNPDGVESEDHHFRVFAGLRDDPFFNNVKGTRAAYQIAAAALASGAVKDGAGCVGFGPSTAHEILDQWRHTDQGPAKNFLAGWTTSAIVISININQVNKGGKFLAVWATTSMADRQINRVGRPLVKNSLLGLLASDAVSNRFKEDFNSATPAASNRFVPEIERSLGIYDSFDGECGNQVLAAKKGPIAHRYHTLAKLLADDRLWINSGAKICSQFFGVELSHAAGHREWINDCGGRAPNYNASNIYRSLLVSGQITGIDDGLERDEAAHSQTQFPFLAAPASENGNRP